MTVTVGVTATMAAAAGPHWQLPEPDSEYPQPGGGRGTIYRDYYRDILSASEPGHSGCHTEPTLAGIMIRHHQYSA